SVQPRPGLLLRETVEWATELDGTPGTTVQKNRCSRSGEGWRLRRPITTSGLPANQARFTRSVVRRPPRPSRGMSLRIPRVTRGIRSAHPAAWRHLALPGALNPLQSLLWAGHTNHP